METAVEKLTVNGVSYVREDSLPKLASECKMVDRKIVRTYSAGVFFGEIVKREGMEVEMVNTRRLWYWNGAASLSELAMRGSSKPKECKFSVSVAKVVLTQAIEILDVSETAAQNIDRIPEWTA